MEKKNPLLLFGPAIVIGSIWGLAEAGLGMGLRACAASLSGAMMTGAALFFISAAWIVRRKIADLVLVVLLASLFKMFDAFLLSLPLKHGAIGNPIFAFFMEGVSFLFLAALLKSRLMEKPMGQAALGGMAALLAANLFPLVKFATGVPACVVPGTGYPLSLYTVHIAVLVSIITVPLGLLAGTRIRAMTSLALSQKMRRIRVLLSPAALALCLVIMTILRLI